MTPDWSKLNTGTEKLILVGAARQAEVPAMGGIPQIAIDGGGRFAVNPVLWAGDGDSGKAPPSIPAFIKYSQDITDFRFCLNGIRSWGWHELHLFGFLGGRRDHELANLGEIQAEMKTRPYFSKAVFYDEDNQTPVLFLQAGDHALKLHGAFSVLALDLTLVTISGKCRYPAEKISLQPLSGQGISNEASGTVSISATAPVMILRGF